MVLIHFLESLNEKGDQAGDKYLVRAYEENKREISGKLDRIAVSVARAW